MKRLVFALLSLVVATGFGSLACSTVSSEEPTRISHDAPFSLATFETGHVGEFLVRRCGTLDCHGRPERPLRLFGEDGLQLRPSPTMPDAATANWNAVVGLEPERMVLVAAARGRGDCPLPGDAPNEPAAAVGDACVRRLLLVSKPLGCSDRSRGCEDGFLGVEHKGGPVLALNDDGYVCLVSWLRGAVDGERCWAAANAFALDAGAPPADATLDANDDQ